MGAYDALFTPFQVGGVTLKNRIVLCAMGGTSPIGFGAQYEEKVHDYYVARAKANVGLMIPGATGVKQTGRYNWLYEAEDVFMGPVRQLMDDIHVYGAKFFMQLAAGFGRSQLLFPGYDENMSEELRYKNLLAPSDGLPNVWNPALKHRALTREEIHNIVDAYAKSALLCKAAGIDGVEIHAVHEGYMLDQFTMANLNHRDDEYGGSLENRLRFATDIIKAIKAACGEDYPVSVRYSVASKMRGFNQAALPGEAYTEFGRSMEESPAVARILEAAGADMLNADNGSYDSWFWAHPPMYMPMACNLPEVSFIKHYVDIPVVCAGRMNDPEIAAGAIRDGKVDGIGLARQLLTDPEWCDKVREERIEDIRPCIACHNGCFAVSHYKGNPCGLGIMGTCALNPLTMHENDRKLTPAAQSKTIAIVGGGIGGMEAARVAAIRGHKVVLFEKGSSLGGVFIAAAAPEFKEQDKKLLTWYRRQMELLGVDVRLNTEATKELIEAVKPDEVILATGSKPRKLPIPGFDAPNAVEATDYLLDKAPVGENVVIIGGGLTGCEIAYDLALKGKKPCIVEMQDDILKIRGLSAANSSMLRELIRYYDIPVYVSAALQEITDEGATVKLEDGTLQKLPADSVILSVGYVSYVPFQWEGAHVLGDAEKVGNLLSVITSAYELAMNL